MIQKAIKYGNSIAVVIPREIALETDLEPGAIVDVTASNSHIEIRRADVVLRISPEDKKFVDELFKQREAVFRALAE